MHGLVSLLPQPFYGRVEALWDQLEHAHGLRGIRVTPYPHFSWEIAADYDFRALEGILRHLAREAEPLTVRTAGLGLFTGERPVLHLPVVKSPELVRLQMRVWDSVGPVGAGRSPLYAPDAWVPHVSLAYDDLDGERIGPVVAGLAGADLAWEFAADNFSVIREPEGEAGKVLFRINL